MARHGEDLAKIAKKLEKIIDQRDLSNTAQALDLLKALQQMPITLDQISKTKIGLTINNLRRLINDEEVSNISKSLIKKWKKLLNGKNSEHNTSGSGANLVTDEMNESYKSQNGSNSNNNGNNNVDNHNSYISKNTEMSSNRKSSIGGGSTTNPIRQSFSRVTHTSDQVRLKCRELLANALKPSDSGGDNADGDIFFDHAELADSIEEHIFKEFKDTNPKYKARIRSRISNLRDSKNPDLKLNVLRGAIKPEKIAIMSAEEMASSEMKELREKFTKEAINDAQMSMTGGTKTDLLKCPNCKGKNCTYNQVQTRSADEPMTTFCFCNECGKRWKFC